MYTLYPGEEGRDALQMNITKLGMIDLIAQKIET